jgi:hypothetical protein
VCVGRVVAGVRGERLDPWASAGERCTPACQRRSWLGERAELRQGAVYATLMCFADGAATSHEIADAFGDDDIVVRARGDLIDPA